MVFEPTRGGQVVTPYILGWREYLETVGSDDFIRRVQVDMTLRQYYYLKSEQYWSKCRNCGCLMILLAIWLPF